MNRLLMAASISSLYEIILMAYIPFWCRLDKAFCHEFCNRLYSGTFSISSGAEGKLYYRAAAFFSNIESPLYTDVYELGVTSFPIGFKKTGTSEIVTDRESGVSMLADTILISFVNGTDPATIRSIAERAGGAIVGTLYTLGIYQIEIEPADSVAVLRSKIELLNSFSEVEFAEANAVSELLDVIPK